MEPLSGAASDLAQQIDDRRQQQQQRLALRHVAKAQRAHRCSVCDLLLGLCMCAEVRPVSCRHAVTVVLHPCEGVRTSSTHKLLPMALADCNVLVFGSQAVPDWRAVMEHVQAQCAVSGKQPIILYPAADAVQLSALYSGDGDHAVSSREGLEGLGRTGLTPAQRAAGLHIIVLDGTWHDTRHIISRLWRCPEAAAALPRVVLDAALLPSASLFQPLRRQPGAARVCTVEAVAALLDGLRELEIAAAAAVTAGPVSPAAATAGDGAAQTLPTAGVAPASTLAAAATPPAGGAGVVVLEPSQACPAPGIILGEATDGTQQRVLPPSVAGRHLRRCLAMFIDRVARQKGRIGPAHHMQGTGYDTW
jgi:DTW domain-containing protein YfiP